MHAMHAAEEEKIEVAEMSRLRAAENASKQFIQPAPIQPVIKHDWTHHFKSVRERSVQLCADGTESNTTPHETPINHTPAKVTQSAPARSTRGESQSDMLYEVVGGASLYMHACVAFRDMPQHGYIALNVACVHPPHGALCGSQPLYAAARIIFQNPETF